MKLKVVRFSSQEDSTSGLLFLEEKNVIVKDGFVRESTNEISEGKEVTIEYINIG